MSYKHITPDQRSEVAILTRTKLKQKNVAELLNKDPSTISRELKRNKDKDGKYSAITAKKKTRERRIKANQRFKKIPRNKKHTLTYDNGSTFASHKEIERKIKVDIYFAYPYHSWERGCNENANGLLRQFFPKKLYFAKITQDNIDRATRLINNRPRKRLNYLTPYEVFYEKRK